MTRRRATTAALMMVLTAVVIAPQQSSAAGCSGLQARGRWTSVARPAFGTTIEPGGASGRLFLTKEGTIWRSTDAGCTWQRVYATDTAVDPDQPARTVGGLGAYVVQTIAVAPTSSRPTSGCDCVYALLVSNPLPNLWSNLTPMLLASSADGGLTWRTNFFQIKQATTATTAPLESPFWDVRLAVSPVDPRVVFLYAPAIGVPPDPSTAAASDDIYVSRDAGATWSFVISLATQAIPYVIAGACSRDLVPDAGDTNVFWTSNCDSADGNLVGVVQLNQPQFSPLLRLVGGTVSWIDVANRPGRPSAVVVTSRTAVEGVPAFEAYRSIDGGRSWDRSRPLFGLVGGVFRITPRGKVLALVSDASGPGGSFVEGSLWDWNVGWRTWQRQVVIRPPLPPTYTRFANLSESDQSFTPGLVPLDAKRGTFAVFGRAENTAVTGPYLMATYNLSSAR